LPLPPVYRSRETTTSFRNTDSRNARVLLKLVADSSVAVRRFHRAFAAAAVFSFFFSGNRYGNHFSFVRVPVLCSFSTDNTVLKRVGTVNR